MPGPQDIARELEDFYRRYIDIFNQQQTDQLVACFAHPYAAISGSRGFVPVAGVEEHRKSLLRAMLALKTRGWVRSEIDSVNTWPLNDHLGMIVSDVTRYKANGSVLESLRACYTLCRDDASWRIVTIVEIRPPFLGPGQIPYPKHR
jgi:hypothetical protein